MVSSSLFIGWRFLVLVLLIEGGSGYRAEFDGVFPHKPGTRSWNERHVSNRRKDYHDDLMSGDEFLEDFDVTKRRSFMGLDNVDYAASTLDLQRTNERNPEDEEPISNFSVWSRPSRLTPSSGTHASRLFLSTNLTPSQMRRMLKTLLNNG